MKIHPFKTMTFFNSSPYHYSFTQNTLFKKFCIRNCRVSRNEVLFFNKVADLRPVTLYKENPTTVFPCEFSENFKNTFLYNI